MPSIGLIMMRECRYPAGRLWSEDCRDFKLIVPFHALPSGASSNLKLELTLTSRRYRAKVDAERKAKNDRFRAERAAEDSARREEQIQRMREEAKEPAFGREIEDCGVLIGWFERQYGSGESQQQQQQGGVLGAIKGAIDGVSRRCFPNVPSQVKGIRDR